MSRSRSPQLFDDPSVELTPAAKWEKDSQKRFLDELFNNVAAYRTTTAFNELMQFISRFHFYAPFNAMLVHVQKPGAKYVMPAHKWWECHGRTIRPGAQPLVILQPFGPVMFVFDVSETEGKPLPPHIENPFGVRKGKVGSQLSRTVENAARDGVRITKVSHGSLRAGSIGPTKTKNQFLQFGGLRMIDGGQTGAACR